ncbi:MAG TPA: BsuPI-related putative proteinase inhibitor [Chthoniobacteraceae bacterium]|jgi:hypothetical protein|nr:BsuPI-related putative proteinase inhibitor [Chthoniobacteraceae bacterium]
MNPRLLLLSLCLLLAAAPVHGEEEKVQGNEPGFLKRATRMVWPFGRKKVEGARPANAGKEWKRLLPTIMIEPVVVKLSDVRQLKVTLQLANRGKKLVQLDFPTTQRIEVLIKEKSGKLVEQWSEDQAFTNEPTLVTINPGERLEYAASVATRDLKAGQSYTVIGFFPNFEQLEARKSIVPQP